MADYNIVKYCQRCNVRFVVPRKEGKRYYCEPCQKIVEEEIRNAPPEEDE